MTMTWQPIETAPKNIEILVSEYRVAKNHDSPDDRRYDYLCCYYIEMAKYRPHGCGIEQRKHKEGFYSSYNFDRILFPTHWMPLPEKPTI